MALIKCEVCGLQISEKAESCPHCGASVEKKKFCKECGNEIPAMAHACPNCGSPCDSTMEKNKDEKSSVISEETEKKVQRYLVENRNKLPQSRFQELRELLSNLNNEQWDNFEVIVLKDPTMLLVLSVVVGSLGVDRFVLGDAKNGALKLLLTLCCGVGLI